MIKLRSLFFLILGLCLSLPSSEAAELSLSEAEKQQKRLELDRYFKSALASEEASAARPSEALKWKLGGSAVYGYHNNVDLNSERSGDFFHKEGLRALLTRDYGRGTAVGAGSLGLEAEYEFKGYQENSDLDRQRVFLKPYIEYEIAPDLYWSHRYELRDLRYLERDELSLTGHGWRTDLWQKRRRGIAHHGHFLMGRSRYSDRKALLGFRSFGGKKREDDFIEAGYGVGFREDRIFLDLEGIWGRNDSNDAYLDFNDYDRYGLLGRAVYRPSASWTVSFFTGWIRRDYDERTFQAGSFAAQEDDAYHLGLTLRWSLSSFSNFKFSYTYHQNESNDAGYEYSGSLVSAGYDFSF